MFKVKTRCTVRTCTYRVTRVCLLLIWSFLLFYWNQLYGLRLSPSWSSGWMYVFTLWNETRCRVAWTDESCCREPDYICVYIV